MGLVLRTLKNLFFWHYNRSTWQYDVLCVLILAFIFLTPQRWFDNGQLRSGKTHRSDAMVKQVILPAETLPPIHVLTGDSRVEVKKEARPIRDAAGNIVAYEVDIR